MTPRPAAGPHPDPGPSRLPFRRPPGLRAALLLAVLACLPGCMLFEEQVDFRSYPMRQIGYAQAVELVREVTGRFCTERFGGVGITWDAEGRNLVVDEVYDGRRRLKLYVHLEPVADGVDIELLALVHTLQSGGGALWGEPQKDVTLEQMLYDAYLAAWLDLRSGA